MNIRRGFIRVWVVISLLYGAVILGVGGLDAVSDVKTIAASQATLSNMMKETPASDSEIVQWLIDQGPPAEREHEARQRLQNFALGAVIPPALFWALLYGGFWAARGFKGKQ